MVAYSALGTDAGRGFQVESSLETAGNRAGIEAETIRERVVVGMAAGWTWQSIVQQVSMDLFEVGYGNWRVCRLKAAQLVRLAYLGS